MSITEYYQKRIASSEAYVKEKKEENADYAQQEEQEKDLLGQQTSEMNALKTHVRDIQNKLEIFVRDNGGLFGLTGEKERVYSGMMKKYRTLNANLKNVKNLRYITAHNITSLSNRQYSNYMSIFNETLGIGELKNQQHLFSALTSNLG
ncbi:hypothetical protein IKB17_02815 [bacterium]|nr:hypothetical protein [bacterium]